MPLIPRRVRQAHLLVTSAFAYAEYTNKTAAVDPQSDEYLSYSKDIFIKSRGNAVRQIWFKIMQGGSREERIALRDTNKLCHECVLLDLSLLLS